MRWILGNAMPRHSLYSSSTDSQSHVLQGDRLLSTSPSQALKEYTSAIELYLALASTSTLPTATRTRCRSACEALITKAEALKRQQSQLPIPQSVSRKSAPIVRAGEEKLSVREETILLKSSKINGGKFPPSKGLPSVTDEAGEFMYLPPPPFLCVRSEKLT
jgi:hypothetical protein